MPHNARVLCLDTDAAVIDEMEKVHADENGIRHMLPKARHYLVKLDNLPIAIAHILKESFLSNGGDATINKDAVTGSLLSSDVLLSGSRKHYQNAFHSLMEQGHGCIAIASEIEAAIRHFDSIPNVPRQDSMSNKSLGSMFNLIGTRTLIMGILNITPDSFSDGGRFIDKQSAIAHGIEMVKNGADILDIGGESTRPGAERVDSETEIERVVPLIRDLSHIVDVPISIDTYKSEVAKVALDNGASIVNDISAASFDPEMPQVIAERQCPAILMHIKGTLQDMQLDPVYDDLMGEVCGFLRERIEALVSAGADKKMLIIDPGIGFGKTVEDNLELLRRLKELKSIGRPILVGTSRKSTIGKILGGLPVEERIEGTAATVALSIANGADIVRVHDVEEMTRVARMTDAIIQRQEAQIF